MALNAFPHLMIAKGFREAPNIEIDVLSARRPIKGSSRLDLFPFFVKGKNDQYLVVRKDEKRMIATHKVGIEAIRLLGRGRTIAETKRELGRRYDCDGDAIDLVPLIDSLFRAEFVRRIDGYRIPSRFRRNLGEATGLFFTLFVVAPFIDFVLKYMPLKLALALAHQPWFRARNKNLEERVVTNYRSVPRLAKKTVGNVTAVCAATCRNVRRAHAEGLLLQAMGPARVHRWLKEYTRISGLDNLTESLAGGRGTILCSFHMGSFSLVPFILGARGIALTAYGAIGNGQQAAIAKGTADLRGHGGGYPVAMINGRMGARPLLRCLERGETVLLFCDQELAAADRRARAANLPRVEFLGREIYAMRGIGWLQWKTGASVVPAVLFWEGKRRHHLIIEPQLTFPPVGGAREHIQAVTAAVFGVLERYVRRDPVQWLKWQHLHKMTVSD